MKHDFANASISHQQTFSILNGSNGNETYDLTILILSLETFSILNGSNGNETTWRNCPAQLRRNFQYPQRIEWQ